MLPRLKDLAIEEVSVNKKFTVNRVQLWFQDGRELSLTVKTVTGRIKGPIDGYDVSYALQNLLGIPLYNDDAFVTRFNKIMWRE